MNILISGASGFIGKNLCKDLFRQSHSLFYLDRSPTPSSDKYSVPGTLIRWDFQSEESIFTNRNFDVVIHLAGEPIAKKLWTKKQKQKIWTSRIESSRALVNMILKAEQKPKVFLCASAIGYYGDRWEEDIDENADVGEGFLAEVCQAWEEAWEPLREAGVRVVSLRSGMVLGPNGGALIPLESLAKLNFLSPLGTGKQWMSWIHIEDWLRAFHHILNTPNIHGPVNLVSPKPIRHQSFMEILTSNLQAPLLFSIPASVLKIIFGEASSLFLYSQKIFPSKLLGSGFNFTYSRLDDALKNIFPEQGEFCRYEAQAFFASPRPEVFRFFTAAKNLERISPAYLNLQVKESSDTIIKEGSRITYKLTPYKIPLRWVSVIDDFQLNSHFSNSQISGPFKYWRHSHYFESQRDGCFMTDIIKYKAPFGWLGRLFAYGFINKRIDAAFRYRKVVLTKISGASH